MTDREYIPVGEGDQNEVETYTEHIMSQYEQINRLPLGDRRKLRPVVDFAYHRGYYLSSDTVDLWGFGEVPVVMEDPETDTSWIALKSLVEPSGLTQEELLSAFKHYEDSDILPEDEIIHIPLPSAKVDQSILMVSVDFAQLLFMEFSPWSSLVKLNLSKMMLRSFYETGAYKQAQVSIYTKDPEGNYMMMGSKPMTEYFAEHGVPSEEEALQQAYRGLTVDVFKDDPGGGTEIIDDD